MDTPYIRITPDMFYSPEFIYVMEHSANRCAGYLYFSICNATLGTGGMLCDIVNGKSVPYSAKRIRMFEPAFSEEEIDGMLTVLEESGLLSRVEDGILKVVNFDQIAGYSERGATS